jgi:negative regulator of flagellin synthesis FlgM
MKIGSPTIDPRTVAETAPRAGRMSVTSTAAIAGGDQVAVSAAAAQMSAAGNEFDSAKVDAIRQAIRDGRFQVNAGAIADRLIADAAALLAPRTGQ